MATMVHAALANACNSTMELVLTHCCADVCWLTYLLQAEEDHITQDYLDWFDTSLLASLEHLLAGLLDAEGWLQAGLAVSKSRLGL